MKKVKITTSLKDCDEERKNGSEQCGSVYISSGFIFCLRSQGHSGDHRGLRVQWQDGDQTRTKEETDIGEVSHSIS